MIALATPTTHSGAVRIAGSAHRRFRSGPPRGTSCDRGHRIMNRTPDDATRLMNLLVAICGESVRHLVEAKVRKLVGRAQS
jgi:hypothetical protein